MPLLRFLKSRFLHALDFAGLNSGILNSSWRARRLAIICWHGISNDDEHAWNPGLFMTAQTFRLRLEQLRAMRCNVLPLAEGLTRVRDGSLPPRAVCLTVDDGDSSFYLRAWPMLREYGFPATLYWTTYYSSRPYAVFDPMLSYLLWKGRESPLRLSDPDIRCSLRTGQQRQQAFTRIYGHAKAEGWTGERKEAFLAQLARALEIDYGDIKSKRVLHLISPAEARVMVAEGLDLQLHTHRHRVPRESDAFAAELAENSRLLRAAGAAAPVHFCYPSGSFLPQFAHWLRESGVQSATTCESGLVDGGSNSYFLPRLMDQASVTMAEFRGGLSGIALVLSRKRRVSDHGFG